LKLIADKKKEIEKKEADLAKLEKKKAELQK
jgi:hypothetical protein